MTDGQEIVTVDQKTGEIQEIERTPDDVLLQAKEVARALQRVIECNEKPLMKFNGKEYLEYPHWLTIGKAYKTTVKTFGAEWVEIGGTGGFKAKAEVIDETTGMVVGTAEAYCMADERNWSNKPKFQLASMAQTRAASKALSNKYRYVAIVAGYSGTPAEEMQNDAPARSVAMPQVKAPIITNNDPDLGPPTETEVVSEDAIPFGGEPVQQPKVITEKQRKFLYAKYKSKGIADDIIKARIKINYGKEHSADLTNSELQDLVKWIDARQVIGE